MDYTDNNIRKFIVYFILFIIVFVIPFCYRTYKKIKGKVNRKKLMQENEYVQKNKERLSKVIDNNYINVNANRNKVIYSIVLFIFAIIGCFLIKEEILIYIIIGLSCVIIAICVYNYNNSKWGTYNEVVKKIINEYDSNLEYIPSNGFSLSEYSLCHFPEKCDTFYSEDMIVNKAEEFYFADITVKSEHTDSDGDTYDVVEYAGSLAKMYIKDINCSIFLGGMRTKLFSNKEFKKIKFENEEFNNLLDAYTDNELLAYKVLTPDVMEQFVVLKKSIYSDIDIRIIGNKLYIRFLTGDNFDKSFSKSIEKKRIFESIAVLEHVEKVMNKIKSIIDSKNLS